MKIAIKLKNEHKFTPDIFGNMKLPEDERFSMVFARRNRLMVQTASLVGSSFSPLEYCRALFVRMDNPIEVVPEDGKARSITIDDIFTAPELEALASLVFTFCSAMQKEDSEDLDPKK